MLLVVDQHPGYSLFTFMEMFAEREALFIWSQLQLNCHISVFHRLPAGDTDEIWWLLSGPGKVGAHPLSSEAPFRGPGSNASCLAFCSVVGAYILPNQICGSITQRNNCSPCYVPFQQTLKAPSLSLCCHCLTTIFLKLDGFVHRHYFKLGVSSLPVAQFTLALGEESISLGLDVRYWITGKRFSFLLTVPEFPMENIVHKWWGVVAFFKIREWFSCLCLEMIKIAPRNLQSGGSKGFPHFLQSDSWAHYQAFISDIHWAVVFFADLVSE